MTNLVGRRHLTRVMNTMILYNGLTTLSVTDFILSVVRRKLRLTYCWMLLFMLHMCNAFVNFPIRLG